MSSLVRAILGVALLSALREIADLGTVSIQRLVPRPHRAQCRHSRGVFIVIVAIECALAVLVTIGRAARPALLASALVGIFLLSCDRLRYHNNRYALLLFAFILAFAPCDRAFVFRGGTPSLAREGPLWAQRLAQLQLAVIYVGSGGSKLLDPDWRQGRVMAIASCADGARHRRASPSS
jgi:hypothetical protein